jgi:hypothetical protein
MRIVAGVGDLVQRTRDGQAQVRYSVAGWSGGRVTLCAVSTMHKKTRSASFLVEPQTQGRWVVSGLASKLLEWFLLIWPQNRWLGFFGLGLKTGSSGLMIWPSKSPRRFLGLGIKNKWASVLSAASQNRRREVGTWHVLRSGGLFRLEASHARVFQFDLKTGGGITTGGARGIIVEVQSRGSWRGIGRCDGLYQTLLPQNYCF